MKSQFLHSVQHLQVPDLARVVLVPLRQLRQLLEELPVHLAQRLCLHPLTQVLKKF